jgi:hypothetical protein
MDEIPDRANVIVQFLGEGQCFANQPPNPLAKSVVQALNMGCLATLLADRTMTLGWKDANIGFPEIAIADRTLAVDRGQRRP